MWIIWVAGIQRREWRNVLILLGSAAAGLILVTYWIAHDVGGLAPMMQIVFGMPHEVSINIYAMEYCWGPPNLLLQAYWIISPFAAIMSLAGLYAAGSPMWGRRFRLALPDIQVIRLTALFGVAQILLAMTMKGWLDLRYLGGTFPPFYLIAGLGFWFLVTLSQDWLQARDRRLTAVLAVAIVVAFAVGDYMRFQRMFVRAGINDLSVKLIIDGQKL
jgi:hypothetical protein